MQTQPAKRIESTAIDLERGQYLLIRRGPTDMDALKKAHAKLRRMEKTLPHDPDFDSVAEVRQHRAGH